MPVKLQVGITGGIGSGKSTVAKIFSSLGIAVYDADSRAKELMNYDPELINAITRTFGEESYVDGQLNRRYLADKVFKVEDQLTILNGLVHPRVAVDYNNWVKEQTSLYTLKEAALLYETGSYKSLDKIIVVAADEEVRVQRVLKRDNRTEKEIRNIIGKQMSQKDAVERADFVVINDESQLVIPQVLSIHNKLVVLLKAS